MQLQNFIVLQKTTQCQPSITPFIAKTKSSILLTICHTFPSNDSTLLIADENVTDLNVDYVRPLRHGGIETGTKQRWRYISTTMVFKPDAQIQCLIRAHKAGPITASGFQPLYGNYVYGKQPC